ncbi:hypothetical protein [Thiolapillus sp.]
MPEQNPIHKKASLVMLLLVSQTASAAAYKCETPKGIEYSDRLCPGAREMHFAPAPPLPQPQPRRLTIIDNSRPHHHYDNNRRAALRASARKLEQQNARLRQQVNRLRQRKEQELANAALTHPERMAAINLYWNGKIDALEREYDRNPNQINRLQDMTKRPGH